MKARSPDELFLRLAEASPIGIYVIERGCFRYLNPQFSITTGFSGDELLGRHCLTLVQDEDRARVRQSAIDMLQNRCREPYEYRVQCKDGSTRWILETVASVEYKGRVVVGNFMDITERKAAENALLEKARRDPLTRLLNHGAFLEELYDSISTNARVKHWLIMADVVGLKRINDVHGHQVGDVVLRKVAAVMDRPGTVVGRYGGDEFAALLVGGTREKAVTYCETVTEILSQTMLADFRNRSPLMPRITMGIAGYPDDAISVTALIRASDEALLNLRSLTLAA